MVAGYVLLVEAGLRTIEQVPAMYREQVRAIVEKNSADKAEVEAIK